MCAQKRKPANPPVSGQQKIGNYLIRRQLGAGGMGVVWLAHDPDLERDVAIKELLIPDDGSGSSASGASAPPDRAVQRFLREARSAAKLSHPNCVSIYHITRQREKLFIVMEYVEGGSLTDLLKRDGPLPWPLALRLTRDAAMGLAAAHEAGLIHRDIKPSNLLLSSSRIAANATAAIVKVADFGLARVAGLGNSDVTLPGGAMLGTPAYMSPEQCRGDEAQIDGRGDIYSLACSLYTLLTARTPFPDASLPAIVHKHLTEPIPDPRAFAPDLPEAIVHIIRRGTEKDPAKRFTSAREMAAAIDAALHASGDSSVTIANDDARTVLIAQTPAVAITPSTSASITSPNNLPHAVTSFVGRERELERAQTLLTSTESSGATRLLALIGAGGTGKTRLALTLARRLATHHTEILADGVWWIELATVTQPPQVATTVASVVGLREPAAGESVIDALVKFIGNKSMLLMLDNCEHIIGAAAQLVDDLLRGCPNLRICATTRQALSITGETTLRVPSLSVPADDEHVMSPAALDELMKSDAVELFAARAVAVAPSFALSRENVRTVATICRRLDGIPLAIELAAARVKMLSVEQVAQRLTDRFKLLVGGSRAALPRQQTLRAMIDWSYELLEPREKLLLARLSVFAGGFTLEAAEAVWADDSDAASNDAIASFDVLDLLAGLVDKSLVVAEEPRRSSPKAAEESGTEANAGSGVRYRTLETLRAYAAEKLRERAAAGAEDVDRLAERHARWVLEVCQHHDISRRRGSLAPVRVLGAEHDNIRAALDWCVARRNGELAIAIIAAMGRYWYRIGLLREGLARCQAVLALPGAEARTKARSQALTNAGILALNYDDPRLGSTYHKESWEIAHELNDKDEIARAANYYGNVSRTLGEYATCVSLYEEAINVGREIGDQVVVAGVLGNLGNAKKDLGRYDEARALIQDELNILKHGGDPTLHAYTVLNLADLELHVGNVAAGLEWAEKSRAMLHELHDTWSETYAWEAIGRAKLLQGDTTGARPILEEALVLLREYGDYSYIANVLSTLGEVELIEKQFDAARRCHSEALAMRVRLHEFRSIIASIEAIARWLATARRDSTDALETAGALFAGAALMRETTGVAGAPCHAADNDRLVDVIAKSLGNARVDETVQKAKAMSQDELFALATRAAS